ncbi:hypothetical protein CLU94_4810 [Janthinobacterium sp. 13]|nr:hypothetical protein CLU94_4810 [Janthinobacterium sp. 13]
MFSIGASHNHNPRLPNYRTFNMPVHVETASHAHKYGKWG